MAQESAFTVHDAGLPRAPVVGDIVRLTSARFAGERYRILKVNSDGSVVVERVPEAEGE